MEYIQNTEMVAYINQRAPFEVFQLSYTGAKDIHLPPGEWMADQFEFSFSSEEGAGTRFAFEIEKKDSSQMFFYGVVPSHIGNQEDPAITIREMMIPVTAACRIDFDQGSIPLLSSHRIETHGECDHPDLGHGTWKGEIQVGNDCSHVLVSISFNGLNNDQFFEQVHSEYLYTRRN